MINYFGGRNRFLSNFYSPSWILYEGISYPTSEHAYQAAKTLDNSERENISNLASPGDAKRAGKSVTLRPDWEEVKESVMYDILVIKFKNPILRVKLIETEDHELIESNTWHDCVWGICTCRECNNVGQNLLGKLLMKIRREMT